MWLTPTHGLSAAHVLLQHRCHCLHAWLNALGGNRGVAQAHAGAVVGRCGVKEAPGSTTTPTRYRSCASFNVSRVSGPVTHNAEPPWAALCCSCGAFAFNDCLRAARALGKQVSLVSSCVILDTLWQWKGIHVAVSQAHSVSL